MFEIIEKVRQKKDREKKIIAFSIAFFICLLIFIFWFLSIYPSFKKQNQIEKKVERVSSGPTNNFKGIIKDNFSQIKKQFNEIKNIPDILKKEGDYYKATSTSEIKATTTAVFSSTTLEKTD